MAKTTLAAKRVQARPHLVQIAFGLMGLLVPIGLAIYDRTTASVGSGLEAPPVAPADEATEAPDIPPQQTRLLPEQGAGATRTNLITSEPKTPPQPPNVTEPIITKDIVVMHNANWRDATWTIEGREVMRNPGSTMNFTRLTIPGLAVTLRAEDDNGQVCLTELSGAHEEIRLPCP